MTPPKPPADAARGYLNLEFDLEAGRALESHTIDPLAASAA